MNSAAVSGARLLGDRKPDQPHPFGCDLFLVHYLRATDGALTPPGRLQVDRHVEVEGLCSDLLKGLPETVERMPVCGAGGRGDRTGGRPGVEDKRRTSDRRRRAEFRAAADGR